MNLSSGTHQLSFLSQGKLLFSCLSGSCSGNLAWQPSSWGGGKIWPDRNMGHTPFVGRVLLTGSGLRRIIRVFLWFIFEVAVHRVSLYRNHQKVSHDSK